MRAIPFIIIKMDIGDYQDEPMAEEDLMNKASLIFDVFVQNSLEATSHSIEWLPFVEE